MGLLLSLKTAVVLDPTGGFRRRYAASDPSVEAALDGCDAFGQLLDAAGKVAGQHAEMAGGDVAAMFIALAQFAAAVYPGQLGLVDRVLVACHEVRLSLSVWLWGSWAWWIACSSPATRWA